MVMQWRLDSSFRVQTFPILFMATKTHVVINPQILRNFSIFFVTARNKTTSAQYVSSRHKDPTFEKLMDDYKNLLKVVSIQELILSDSSLCISLNLLSRLAQKLHLNRGALSFLRKYPHVFSIFYDPSKSQPFCRLTATAHSLSLRETLAASASTSDAIDRLLRLLAMSPSRILPLRAIFKVWRELGLPDDFENSVIFKNPHLFSLLDAREPNTHLLKLVDQIPNHGMNFSPSVENWRRMEREKGKEELLVKYCFKLGYPPGMRLTKGYRAKVKIWQMLCYSSPYEEIGELKNGECLEKRAVAIVHEFLSLTVEKMIEVEKISHFRKWFDIDLNIRDLFLDHPGIFYLSTKGKRHTVFLREAYEKGCLIYPNPLYSVRRELLYLIRLGRRSLVDSTRDI